MPSDIPAEILSKCQAKHGDAFHYLNRTRLPVGQSGLFYHLQFTCRLHPEVGVLLQRQDSHIKGQIACPSCASRAREGRDRSSFETVVESCRAVHGNRYDYLNIGTIPGKPTTVTVRCPKGHTFTCTVSNHTYRKSGCPVCTLPRHTFETAVQAAREKHGDRFSYTAFHPHELGKRSTISFLCPDHGPQTQTLTVHLKGVGCGKCGRAQAGAAVRAGRENALQKLERSGSPLRLLDETYTYGTAKASFVCPNGHVTQKLPALLEYNPGCNLCTSRVSKANREIQALLPGSELEGSLGLRFKVDVLHEATKLVVEHHGIIWHSDRYLKSPGYHRDRMRKIQELGYRYLQIFSDEWALRRGPCEAIIRRTAGLDTSPRIGARSTSAVEVSAQAAQAFLEEHHIQGSPLDCSRAFGLTHDGQLIAVATFTPMSSSRKLLEPGAFELSRFATACRLPGGFSKLLKHARSQLGATSLRTISDNRLFTGQTYARCGFRRVADIPVDYAYTDGTRNSRMHKANFQKALLVARHPELSMEQTEQQMTQQIGLYRVYDAGKVLWEWQA